MPKNTNFSTVSLAELSVKGIAPQRDPVRPVVLVVDDETVIADTLSAILERHDIAAMTAYNGQSALEIARVIPPDLLLTDVVMPDMSGIDLAIAIMQIIPDCKILLFSGQAATMDLLAAERNAGRDFSIIAKPIHPTELLVRVAETLESQPAKSPNIGPGMPTGPVSNRSLDHGNGYAAAHHPGKTKSLRKA